MARKKVTEKPVTDNTFNKSTVRRKVIPFPLPPANKSLRQGSFCGSAWDVHEVIKDRLLPGTPPELIFLYLDQNKTLIGSIILQDKGDTLDRDDIEAITRGLTTKCRWVICIRSRTDIQSDRQNKDHEISEKHGYINGQLIKMTYDRLAGERLAGFYLAGESMMFSYGSGWLSFEPFPVGVEITREKGLDHKRSLSGIPQGAEEKHLLKVYRRLLPMNKDRFHKLLANALALDLKYRKTVQHIAEGKPLSDEEAFYWSFLRDHVLSGEFSG